MTFDYTSLVASKNTPGSIRAWLNYDLIDPDSCLLDAQAHIYTILRCREMRSSANVSITLGASTAALPAQFLDPTSLVFADTGDEIIPTSENVLQKLRPWNTDGTIQSGRAERYSIWDEAFQFDTSSDAAYTAKLLFYKRPDFLSGANLTNFLTTRYPNLLRSACLMMAADYASDEEAYARWEKRTAETIAAINVTDDYAWRGAA